MVDHFGQSNQGFDFGVFDRPSLGGVAVAGSQPADVKPPASPVQLKQALEKSAAEFTRTNPRDSFFKEDGSASAEHLGTVNFEKTMLSHALAQTKPAIDDPEEKELLDCMINGVDPRTKWGQRFTRSSDGKSQEYFKMTQKDKQEFRKDWASKEAKKIKRTRERSQAYQRIDETTGEYVPFSILWQREGGHRDPQALKAAITHATKCVQMGTPWVTVNDMTDRVEYLHLKRTLTERFSHCWSLYEKAMLEDTTEAPALQQPEQQPPESRAAAASEVKTPKVPKRTATTPGSEGKHKKPRAKSATEEAMIEAMVVKTSMTAASTRAKALLEAIDQDAAWSRFKTMAELVENAVKKIRDGMDSFARAFLSTDSKQLRQLYPDDSVLTIELRKFTSQMTGLVDTLQKEVNAIILMQQANGQAHSAVPAKKKGVPAKKKGGK